MSKNHRGKGIYDKPKRGRGTCPKCKRTGVKIIYEKEMDGKKTAICKVCNASLIKMEKAKEVKKPSPEKPVAQPSAAQQPAAQQPAAQQPAEEN